MEKQTVIASLSSARTRTTFRFSQGKVLCLLLMWMISNPLAAQRSAIDSLQKIIALHRNDTTEVNALNALATEFLRKDIPHSKQITRQALNLGREIQYHNGTATAFAQLAIASSKIGETDSANHQLNLLKLYAQKYPETGVKATYSFTAGLIYKNEGKFKEALPHMIGALAGFVALHQKTSEAGQLLNIGNAYTSLGEYKNAVNYHLRALKMFEDLKNKRGESFCNQSIGNDFVALGQPAVALPYLERALAQKEELKDQRSIASAWTGLADLYKSTKEYDKALYYHRKALKASQELKLTSEEAQGNFEIGTILGFKKDFVKATGYLKTSKKLARQMGDSALSKAVDAELIGQQSRITELENPEQNLLRSIRTSVESGRKQTELSSYRHLIEHYKAKRDFEKAFVYQTRLQQITDSLQGTQLQFQIKNLEEEFKADRKEREIALLKKDQQLQAVELQRQKTIQYFFLAFVALFIVIAFLVINRYLVVQRSHRLIEIERVRNGIARDLHDDIGSTLSSINIISRMALQSPMDETNLSRFGKIEDHSRKMMDNMSDIVWSINPGNDTADKTVIRMKEFAAEILEPKNIRYEFHESGALTGAKMSVNQRKNLFLIFKESMNNAAKYSKCSTILIRLKLTQHNFSLQIQDDGTGFNRSSVRRGNGLSNIEARAAMMGSVLHIETSEGKGTLISVSTLIT